MQIKGRDKIDPANLTSGTRVLPNGTLVYPTVEEEEVET